MIARAGSLRVFVLFVVTFFTRTGAAEQPCAPPFCFETPKVTVQSPTVRVDPTIDARAQAEARARAEAEARASLEAKARIDAMWRAYWDWDARIRADATIRVNAQIDAELRMRSFDRFAGVPPPITRPPTYSPARYPRTELGVIPPCAGLWSGPGRPLHYGLCPEVRVRVSETFAIALDPTVTVFDESIVTPLTVGVSPSAVYSFTSAGHGMGGSHAFVSAGFDVWTPVTDGTRSPDVLLGAHFGLGAHAFPRAGWGGLGVETRALVRTGIGTNDDPTAEIVATPRLGFEVRLKLLVGL